MTLIEGEDPTADDAIDARHWQDVYSKLLDFTLRRTAEQPMMVPILEERLERYGERLNFWSARATELQNIVIDEAERTVTHSSGVLTLTRREFQIVRFMLDNPGRKVSSRRLLLEAWHDSALPEEAIRSYICRVRRKLAQLDFATIVTDPRGGYRLIFQSAGCPRDEAAVTSARQSG
ncbi:MAG: transcriptional regulator [Candidatus Dormibacteria bacterium]